MNSELFPESLPLPCAAIWPNEGTRAHEAITALLSGPQNQADYFAGWRLSAYVGELVHRLRWKIINRNIPMPGNRTKIREYAIDYLDEGNILALNNRPAGIP